MIYLSIKDLWVQYDNNLVLENFNADFQSGLHWIQGTNGSGKSSLLKSICGINPVEINKVKIMNHDLFAAPLKAKNELCYVPDKPDVYPFMTGLQYLSFIASVKNAALPKALFSWLEDINLTQFNDTEFCQMSFGTRRKFILSAVFIGDPNVILLDEPFNGLDKASTAHFCQWLIKAKQDKCLLIVSHEPNIIDDISDSIIVLD